MCRKAVLISFLLSLMAPFAFAEDQEGGENNSCGKVNGARDFIECALKYHPRIRETRYDEMAAKGLVQSARQIPNPELEAGFSQTDNIGQISETVELRLMMPLEIWGRRSSRIRKSKAESDLITAEILETKEKVVITALSKLYRLRQVKKEIELTSESLSTFRKVKKQYSRRKSLGPEQAVSLDIFSIAEADYTMRLSALEAEKGEVIRELSLFLGRAFKEDEFLLPATNSDWPKLDAKNKIVGSAIQIARAKKRVAEGDLDLAKSEAWPALSVGPTYALERENSDEITTVGISIEMPLPVFNLNGGAKSIARAEKEKAIIRERTKEQNLIYQRENLLQIYNSVTERLRKIDPDSFGQAKHRRIHKFLKRGVVEAALVIESHRQIVEFQEHTNEQELNALLALWQLRALDGTLLDQVKNIKNP